MAPPEPGRTLIHWHRQEERVVSCIPREAAATRVRKAPGDSGGYEGSALGCLQAGGAGAAVFRPSGWLAALAD
jgi:hypothetical protein